MSTITTILRHATGDHDSNGNVPPPYWPTTTHHDQQATTTTTTIHHNRKINSQVFFRHSRTGTTSFLHTRRINSQVFFRHSRTLTTFTLHSSWIKSQIFFRHSIPTTTATHNNQQPRQHQQAQSTSYTRHKTSANHPTTTTHNKHQITMGTTLHNSSAQIIPLTTDSRLRSSTVRSPCRSVPMGLAAPATPMVATTHHNFYFLNRRITSSPTTRCKGPISLLSWNGKHMLAAMRA